MPQGDAWVDIGYQYVATDDYGNPLDTAGTGVPDYIADSNGDGVYDAGDLGNWLNPFFIYDQGVSYGGYYPANVRLGYWKFDTNLVGQSGQRPLASNNVTLVPSFSGNAAALPNLSTTELNYKISEANGTSNLGLVSRKCGLIH